MIRTWASPRPQSWWRRVNPRSRTSRCVIERTLNYQRPPVWCRRWANLMRFLTGADTDSFLASVTAVNTDYLLESVASLSEGRRRLSVALPHCQVAFGPEQWGRPRRFNCMSAAATVTENVLLPKRRNIQFPAQPPQMLVLRHDPLVHEPLNPVQAEAVIPSRDCWNLPEQISFCKVYPDGNYAFRGAAIQLHDEYWKVRRVSEGQPSTTPRPNLTVRWWLRRFASGEVAPEMFGLLSAQERKTQLAALKHENKGPRQLLPRFCNMRSHAGHCSLWGMVSTSEATAFPRCAMRSDAVVVCARVGRRIFPKDNDPNVLQWDRWSRWSLRPPRLTVAAWSSRNTPEFSLHVQDDVHAGQLKGKLVFTSQFPAARVATEDKPEEGFGRGTGRRYHTWPQWCFRSGLGSCSCFSSVGGARTAEPCRTNCATQGH